MRMTSACACACCAQVRALIGRLRGLCAASAEGVFRLSAGSQGVDALEKLLDTTPPHSLVEVLPSLPCPQPVELLHVQGATTNTRIRGLAGTARLSGLSSRRPRGVQMLATECDDVHVCATLLKRWLRKREAAPIDARRGAPCFGRGVGVLGESSPWARHGVW